jgi:phospholipase C
MSPGDPPGVDRLRHVVMVMLENRSFDHLLGYLDHPSADFDGIGTPPPTNPEDPGVAGSALFPTERRRRLRLRVDPDHAHAAVMTQLGLSAPAAVTPTNDGFVHSYEEKATGGGPGAAKARRAGALITWIATAFAAVAIVGFAVGIVALGVVAAVLAAIAVVARFEFVPKADHYPGDGRRIMWCWDPAAIPAMATLAKEFAVCTRWFCSVPGETWPNRQFVHAATSAGTVDIVVRGYGDRTIFQLLDDHGSDWRIYFDGPAQVLCYPALWATPSQLARWHPIQELYDHIARGDLPTYTFVEPNHGYIGRSYSQHSGNNRRTNGDFRRGDKFVAGIYEALRKNPELFAETALVITHDEHGGTFDRVPPEKTVSPDGRDAGSFDFTRYGPRVPAIVVSPWVPRGTVDNHTVYDHASVPATLRTRFAPTADPLTDRDRHAETFLHLLSLPSPRGDAPDLSRRAWTPRAAWTPLASFIGWLMSLVRRPQPMHDGLARLTAQVDAAIPKPAGPDPAVITTTVLTAPAPAPAPAPAGGEGMTAPLPPPPTATPRRTSARAMHKLARAAEAARRATPAG